MDPYITMGVTREMSDDDIKKAYRSLAIKYHPDHSGADTASKMADITEAYDLIKTKELRAKYDKEHSFHSDFTLWSKLFGECNIAKNFGKKPTGKSMQKKGRNITKTIRISKEKLFMPGQIPITYSRNSLCYNCSGTGASKFRKCPKCGGKGKIRSVISSSEGAKDVVTKCLNCMGKGLEVKEACNICGGTGYIKKDVTMSFYHDGKTMDYRFIGKGNSGKNNGENGDLMIKLRRRK